jgi:hypothetical protein
MSLIRYQVDVNFWLTLRSTLCAYPNVYALRKLNYCRATTTNRENRMKMLFATVALAGMIAASGLAQTASAQTAGQYARAQQSRSLDGKFEGHARTCGQDTFAYDSEGTPTGPYCH